MILSPREIIKIKDILRTLCGKLKGQKQIFADYLVLVESSYDVLFNAKTYNMKKSTNNNIQNAKRTWILNESSKHDNKTNTLMVHRILHFFPFNSNIQYSDI